MSLTKKTVLLAALSAPALAAVHHAVNHDVYAYPQFEVVFDDSYILPHDAQALLAKQASAITIAMGAGAGVPASSDSSDIVPSGAQTTTDGTQNQQATPKEMYELMDIHPGKYLCSIPIIEPKPTENATATALAIENEKKELVRASEDGWKILKTMDGECLYFMSGWWSYKYCYDSYIVQFHALASAPGQAPPVPDPKMAAYVLGRTNKAQTDDGMWLDDEWQKGSEDVKSSTTDMQIKGDQRYLVHRLTGGTMCDLTNRERTIEVQYHCTPGATHDSIAWIKEVTTCAYLMVVNTPRLCKDAAFLPQKEAAANTINCREISPEGLSPEETKNWFSRRKAEEAHMQEMNTAHKINVKATELQTNANKLSGQQPLEVMIEFDSEEIKNLGPEEVMAMAHKRAEEFVASSRKDGAKNNVPDSEASKEKKPMHDDTAGELSVDDIIGALSHLLDEEVLAQDEVETRREVEETLAIYQGFAKKFQKEGKRVPKWVQDHITVLEDTLSEANQFGVFEAYQDLKNKETAADGKEQKHEAEGDEEGSQEEFFKKKDEL
ncbi:hypothetical protein BROUX41_003274 [Berkeleyomyces rouxiae]|uniref:uncharacterized protein n=1 Tax=Berkeleyomyces rouxiae TaxID=2035830 RepID=UPI003B7CE55C